MATIPPSSFVIRTENFELRPLERSDACAALETWTEDEAAAEMLNMKPHRWSIAEQAGYFSRYEGQQTRYLLGLFPKGRKEAVGLFIVKLRPADSVMLVTHLLGNKEWRGTGATREGSIGVFDFFFNKLDYKKAKANVRPGNKAMLWLLLNGGWSQEAYLTKHLRLNSSKERADIIVMGILADEWRASRHRARTVRRP